MIFSNLTKKLFNTITLVSPRKNKNFSLESIEHIYGISVDLIDEQRLIVVSPTELNDEDSVEKLIQKAQGSAIGIFCHTEKVDIAKKTPGRTWISGIISKFEKSGWCVADALTDGCKMTFLVAFAPASGYEITAKSEFYHDGRYVSLTYASETDIMRTKSVLSGSFYERYMLDNIQKNYSGGDIIDVGANVGNHTVFFGLLAQKTKNRVYAIEPADGSLKILNENIRVNKLEDIVSISPIAAGEERGQVILQPGSASNHLGAMKIVAVASPEIKSGSLEAPVAPLDEIIPPCRPVSVIKVDVEGYEVPALRGGRRLIEAWHPDLYIEAGTHAAYEAIQEVLLPMGYERKGVFNDTPTHWFTHTSGRKIS